MKTIIIGAKGQLGCDLLGTFKDINPAALDCEDIDISSRDSVKDVFDKYKPELVINSAAMTNVPKCDEEDTKAFLVNGLGAKFIAQNCLRYGSTLVHISTDYVFDGEKISPYTEEDTPNPINSYGISKLAGEYYIKALMRKFFIVRTSGLYGAHRCIGKGTNFVETMIDLSSKKNKLSIIDDEVLTPTYSLDLAYQIKELVAIKDYGIFHATNEGECSWYEFAKEIFDFIGKKMDLVGIKQKDYPSSVRRPRYSVLENKRLKDLGINKMRHWKDALHSFLSERTV